MARTGRTINHDFENLMDDVAEYGTRTAETTGHHASGRGRGRRNTSGGFSAALATLVSIIALVFSGYSFYETGLKQASLRFYAPPLVTTHRRW